MVDRFHGSACPDAFLDGARRDHSDILPLNRRYRGCSRSSPRSGTARTAPAWILRATGHSHSVAFVRIRLDLGDLPWAGVPCWSGGAQRWLKAIPATYAARYASHVLPQMPGNPISLETLLRVAEARAEFADHRTGRDCRPTNKTLAERTGLSVRTVQRASKALRLLGVATEVLRGRQRSRDERMASWRVGDRGRGWASVWVLHDSRFSVLSPHPGGSSFRNQSPVRNMVTTPNRRLRVGRGAQGRPSNDAGTRLAQRWAADPNSPTWVRRYRTVAPWARVLNAAAEHGWTPRDVNQVITDYAGVGNWVPARPYKPAGLLGAILRWHGDLAERPAALDEAREAEELAADRARIAAQLAERETSRQARAAGRAALGGQGHAAARAALAEALERIRARRSGSPSAEGPRR